jgi:hypothetical protein
MTRRPRRSALGILLAIVALAAGACGPGNASTSPTASIAAASATPAPTPTAVPSVKPTPPPTAKPTPKPTACAITPETGPLPTDRFVDIVASTTPDADLLTFKFGNMSVPGPGGPPVGEFTAAEPPYTFGPSGLPIEMVGEHVVQVVFRGMSIVADTGDPVYQGPPELSPDDPSLKHAVEFDESEGVVGWYVGYDGTGCVTLSRSGNDVILTFAHAG